MRQERSDKVMEELHGWLVEMKPRLRNDYLMRNDYLQKAVRYMLEHRQTVYLKDDRVPIDNNAVERELRRVAVGRKNYLFAGSEAGGHRAAVMYSILPTCRHARVKPSEYLQDVLWELAQGWKAQRIKELTPHAWPKPTPQAQLARSKPPASSTNKQSPPQQPPQSAILAGLLKDAPHR